MDLGLREKRVLVTGSTAGIGFATARATIKYQMPTYVLNGNLVSFGAYKHHIGLYPTSAAMDPFADELVPYLAAKSSLRFPLDQPCRSS